MPLCRHHPARQCACPRALVKMRRGAHTPMLIDTIQGRWSLSPIDLGENWPALLKHMRNSGDRVFRPVLHFSNTYRSPQDALIESFSWDYLASRCAHQELQSRFGNAPPVSGFDPENELYRAFNQAHFLYRQGNINGCAVILVDCLDVFQRICDRLGAQGGLGFGKGMYMEVIEMGRLFAPLVAEIDPNAMYSLLESFYRMTGGDDQTLRRMLMAITPTQQGNIWQIANQEWQMQNSFLSQHILQII